MVDCKASYPNLYKYLSTAYSTWIHLIFNKVSEKKKIRAIIIIMLSLIKTNTSYFMRHKIPQNCYVKKQQQNNEGQMLTPYQTIRKFFSLQIN